MSIELQSIKKERKREKKRWVQPRGKLSRTMSQLVRADGPKSHTSRSNCFRDRAASRCVSKSNKNRRPFLRWQMDIWIGMKRKFEIAYFVDEHTAIMTHTSTGSTFSKIRLTTVLTSNSPHTLSSHRRRKFLLMHSCNRHHDETRMLFKFTIARYPSFWSRYMM